MGLVIQSHPGFLRPQLVYIKNVFSRESLKHRSPKAARVSPTIRQLADVLNFLCLLSFFQEQESKNQGHPDKYSLILF